VTGPAVPWPISVILRNALGAEIERVIELANDPRYLTGIVPSANIVTDRERAVRVLPVPARRRRAERRARARAADDPPRDRRVGVVGGSTSRSACRSATGSASCSAASGVSLFGADNEHAFGHVGFSNIFSWADPERALSVALCASGKPCSRSTRCASCSGWSRSGAHSRRSRRR
jgi:hypothetical protein